MSGTSLDGIDAAYVEIVPHGSRYALRTLRFQTIPFDAALQSRLLAALPPKRPDPAEIAALDRILGEMFGVATERTVAGRDVDFVATHGLTLFHDGPTHRTMQIGDPYAIRERARATVVFDFRRADCAAGGHGAPLVPYVDAMLLGDPARAVVALNLGGIANLTIIPPNGAPADVVAWDVGPGNMLLDAFVRARTNGSASFDRDGATAGRGRAAPEVVERLIGDPYFTLQPPKSTGRERFGPHFLERHAELLDPLPLEDGCATLVTLTVEAIARDVARYGPANARVVVSGGGARNGTLLAALTMRLGAGYQIVRSDALGIDPDAKEALAFAVLGYEALRGRAAGLPRVTGARTGAVLGAIVPHDLGALLKEMERELAANAAE